jgi:hypothetical protein
MKRSFKSLEQPNLQNKSNSFHEEKSHLSDIDSVEDVDKGLADDDFCVNNSYENSQDGPGDDEFDSEFDSGFDSDIDEGHSIALDKNSVKCIALTKDSTILDKFIRLVQLMSKEEKMKNEGGYKRLKCDWLNLFLNTNHFNDKHSYEKIREIGDGTFSRVISAKKKGIEIVV